MSERSKSGALKATSRRYTVVRIAICNASFAQRNVHVFFMLTRVQCILCVVIVSMNCRQSKVGEKRDTFPGVCVCELYSLYQYVCVQRDVPYKLKTELCIKMLRIFVNKV